MIEFQVSLNFDPVKKNTGNTMSDLYFNEESDVIRSTRKKLNIFMLQLPIFYLLE